MNKEEQRKTYDVDETVPNAVVDVIASAAALVRSIKPNAHQTIAEQHLHVQYCVSQKIQQAYFRGKSDGVAAMANDLEKHTSDRNALTADDAQIRYERDGK